MLTESDALGQVLGRPGAGSFSREYPKTWVNKRTAGASKRRHPETQRTCQP